MPVSLRFALPLACLSLFGCSGSNFELASAEDGGALGTDTGESAPDSAPGSLDGGESDAAPACNTDGPAAACSGLMGSDRYDPQFTYNGSDVIGRLDARQQHAISYVLDQNSRHEKLILNLHRQVRSGGVYGVVRLAAYREPCEGVLIPLGKERVLDAAGVDGVMSFYFNESANFLDALPAGTRLTFVLSTNSTAYEWDLLGNSTGTGAPGSLRWSTKKDGSEWTPGGAGRPSATTYVRFCPGG